MTRYTVYVVPDEFNVIKKLPGKVRHRVKRAIDDLAGDPRPPHSKPLDVTDMEGIDCELRRLRIDNWRIVYAITETEHMIDVLAVRKRPPYDYGDLEGLLDDVT
ncbi:MAG: type II toxin-antitoxin system RelE/ParE family toxin [Planctomycetes bacterium]|nr:type II toxin-antitoxin system RelE/ParE family toxin [Planctomycetota bacterium]